MQSSEGLLKRDQNRAQKPEKCASWQPFTRDLRTAKALFAQIQAAGYAGGYSAVTDFTRAWRGSAGKAPHAFVPLSFEFGEAFQFDWSEEGLVVGGIYYRLPVSHLKLCASRAFWLVAYPSQGHEMLFDAHTRSFAALGGIARRGIYDNMKTAVDKVHKGKGRVVNARFAVMCAHYLFDADFCLRRLGLGKKSWSKRTCRTVAGASGSMRRSASLARSKHSTPGSASAAGPCGIRSWPAPGFPFSTGSPGQDARRAPGQSR